jgi:hypothetical protein
MTFSSTNGFACGHGERLARRSLIWLTRGYVQDHRKREGRQSYCSQDEAAPPAARAQDQVTDRETERRYGDNAQHARNDLHGFRLPHREHWGRDADGWPGEYGRGRGSLGYVSVE